LFKDINSQFVLQVYRDAFLSGAEDMTFLRYCWPAVKAAIDYYKKFDTRGTGLPEHPDMPDQTYDTWPMRGTSAYTGSLWLAALKAADRMAGKLGDVEASRSYDAMFKKAQTSFIKQLWNGQYFNFDTGSPYRSAIMADQLCGQWYANVCGLGEVVPRDMARKALESIFKFNVMGFHKGEMGAVNGMNPDGSILTHNMESEEVWSGTTLALASFFKSEGMLDEAYKTARGVYNVVYVDKGYWFRTPEAWDTTGNFRAAMYMRPQSIWAMEFGKPARDRASARKIE
jgi:non-lysosomal glucosylceramidase